jgi:hypothetical protein
MLTKSFTKTLLLKEIVIKIYEANSDGAKNVLAYRQDNGVEAFLPGALYCRR